LSDTPEILDDNLEPIPLESDYDSTSEFDEGYTLKRITFKSLMGFVLSVLNFERGILFSIKELIIRPKSVIDEYLKNDRKKLVNPVRFLVFSTAIATFLNIALIHSNENFNSIKDNFDEGFQQGVKEKRERDKNAIAFQSDSVRSPLIDSTEIIKKKIKKEKAMAFFSSIPEKMTQWSDKLTFVSTFFYTFFAFLFFKKNNYNFTEHLVINSYLISVSNVLSIIFILFALASQSITIIMISGIIGFVFHVYFWMYVYHRKTIGGLFRSILAYIIANLSLMIIAGVFAFAYAVLILKA